MDFWVSFFMTSSRGEKVQGNCKHSEDRGGRKDSGLGVSKAGLSGPAPFSHSGAHRRAWLTQCPATSPQTESCWSSGYKWSPQKTEDLRTRGGGALKLPTAHSSQGKYKTRRGVSETAPYPLTPHRSCLQCRAMPGTDWATTRSEGPRYSAVELVRAWSKAAPPYNPTGGSVVLSSRSLSQLAALLSKEQINNLFPWKHIGDKIFQKGREVVEWERPAPEAWCCHPQGESLEKAVGRTLRRWLRLCPGTRHLRVSTKFIL